MESVTSLFVNKLKQDDRVPVLSTEFMDYHVNFFAPNYLFFLQIGLILWVQMVLGCLLGIVMYYGVIRPKTKSSTDESSQGLLLGYGFVIPIAFWFPFQLIEWLDIRNIGFRLGCASLPMTVTLRCLEAIHGDLSQANTHSLWDYVVSVGFILRPKFDKAGQTIPITGSTFGQQILKHFAWLGFFALMFHAVSPSGFYPFATTVRTTNVWVSFEVGHLYNTFVQAALMNITLAFSMSGVSALGSLMTGIAFDDRVTDFPMFFSDCPSDFWGRRWNNLIHVGLKRGVYKPVRRKTGNRILASVAAFCVSGIYHEYVWLLLFYATTAQANEGISTTTDDGACCPSCYCDTWFGKQLLFFGWNGVLIASEYLVGNQVSPLTKHLPSLLRSHLVVLLSLPVGHLFTADMTKSGYFEGLQQALPIIQIIR